MVPVLILAPDPIMTVSADSSDVNFNNCGFSEVEAGVCVIQVNAKLVQSTGC